MAMPNKHKTPSLPSLHQNRTVVGAGPRGWNGGQKESGLAEETQAC